MCADTIRAMLGKPDRHTNGHGNLVQDPYSLRCMPQVHGAAADTVSYVHAVLEREINSATDNPLLFMSGQGFEALSGGNFHGQPVAFALDFLAIAVQGLANISERRVEQMLNPKLSGGLPAFLAQNPGVNSGYMIPQVTAAALINENKVLCHPASVDSISTSAAREDHVSMGMTSGNKLGVVIENTTIVLAIELLCAAQALDLKSLSSLSPAVQKVRSLLRAAVPFASHDRLFMDDMTKSIELLKSGTLLNEIRDLL